MTRARWSVADTELVVDNSFYRLRRDRVVWPDGTQTDYYVSVRPDVVITCPVTRLNQLILVNQYKHAVGKRTLELPAGILDRGETALHAARRELLEETGYKSKMWKKVGRLFDDSSKNTNRVHIFAALESERFSEPTPDAGERAAGLRVSIFSFEEALRMIRCGRIVSQSTVSALLMCADYLRYESDRP